MSEVFSYRMLLMYHAVTLPCTSLMQVDRGSLVFDPYIGTGSITVAAAYHKAQVMGTDIDMRVVRLVRVCMCWQRHHTHGPLGVIVRACMSLYAW